ncbi:MAG: cell division protein FtsA [Chitinispirillia bacterium]|nr:cell division protein FtsA [Chitinispirillia bacterium]MCL2267799.1 cell division protein FtsA [Chitinispirillia bacterium]
MESKTVENKFGENVSAGVKAEKKIIVAGLDIGTTKVACVIAQIDEDGKKLEILGQGKCSSVGGLRKGVVVDMDRTVAAIKEAVEHAKTYAPEEISYWVAGIAGEHIKSMASNGKAIISENVTENDIQQTLNIAENIQLPDNCEIIHAIPQAYILDDHECTNPRGMHGKMLVTYVHIITAQTMKVRTIRKCVEMAGVKLDRLVLEPLASSEAVLSQDDKDMGVALVDIGGGTTDIAVYFGGKICHVAIVGMGGENITRDVAQVLRCTVESAEKLKKESGCAFLPLVKEDERIIIPGFTGRDDKEAGRDLLGRVIEARVEEILSLAMREIMKTQRYDQLGAGIMLTGGGALLAGMKEKAESVFQRPVRIGQPSGIGGMEEMVSSPVFSTAVGLCKYVWDDIIVLKDREDKRAAVRALEEEKAQKELAAKAKENEIASKDEGGESGRSFFDPIKAVGRGLWNIITEPAPSEEKNKNK